MKKISALYLFAAVSFAIVGTAFGADVNNKTFFGRTDCETATHWPVGGQWSVGAKDCDMKLEINADGDFLYSTAGLTFPGYIDHVVGGSRLFFEALKGAYIPARVSMDGTRIATSLVMLSTDPVPADMSKVAGKTFAGRPDCGITTNWFMGVVGQYTGKRCRVSMSFNTEGDFTYMANDQTYAGSYREQNGKIALFFNSLSGKYIPVATDLAGSQLSLPNFMLQEEKPVPVN